MRPKNVVFYYTSTGNSLVLARRLADDLGDSVLVNMAKYQDQAYEAQGVDVAAFVFPVHAWGSLGTRRLWCDRSRTQTRL